VKGEAFKEMLDAMAKAWTDGEYEKVAGRFAKEMFTRTRCITPLQGATIFSNFSAKMMAWTKNAFFTTPCLTRKSSSVPPNTPTAEHIPTTEQSG
jgi:hypothetical protein